MKFFLILLFFLLVFIAEIFSCPTKLGYKLLEEDKISYKDIQNSKF